MPVKGNGLIVTRPLEDEAARRRELRVKYQEDIDDITAAAKDQGMMLSDPAVMELLASARGQAQNDMVAELGASAYAQFQQLDRLQPASDFVGQVAGRVFDSDTPLTVTQGEQLTQILAEASPDYQKGNQANMATVDWNTIATQAGTILSVQQLATLESMSSDFQARHQLKQLVSRLAVQTPAMRSCSSRTNSTN